MGLRDECEIEASTGIDEPITRAPCAYDDDCIGFEQSAATDYKPRWFLKSTCLRTLLTLCGVNTVYEPTSASDVLLTSSQMRWVQDPDTGEECLSTLPAAAADVTCSDEVKSCGGFISDGAEGDVTESCDNDLCVEWTNTGQWPAIVTPKVTVLCARLNGGPARIEFPTTTNGVDNSQLCIAETGSAASTTVTIDPDGDPEHTHETTTDVTGSVAATYSGTTELRPIIVQPGDTIEFCGAPRAVLTGDNDAPFSVDWGDHWLCLESTSQITPDTIASLTSG